MMTVFPEFNPKNLIVQPVEKRRNNLSVSDILPLSETGVVHHELEKVASAIVQARKDNASVILMMGAHVIRDGVQRYLIDLMEKGFITCIATNGAGVIHDYEFARIGGTTETVSHYIKDGRFGFWKETGDINTCVLEGYRENIGLGETVGREILRKNFPYKELSVTAAAYRLGIPFTVHVGIGYDIVCQHPNYDGAAYGATSHRDFLRFAQAVTGLEKGVVMNFGSAVMGPEIYLKALSMARNEASKRKELISAFTVLVCDLAMLPSDYRQEPSPHDPGYYFRPWKTMLVRTVNHEGDSYYVRDRHRHTVPQLWSGIQNNTAGVK